MRLYRDENEREAGVVTPVPRRVLTMPGMVDANISQRHRAKTRFFSRGLSQKRCTSMCQECGAESCRRRQYGADETTGVDSSVVVVGYLGSTWNGVTLNLCLTRRCNLGELGIWYPQEFVSKYPKDTF